MTDTIPAHDNLFQALGFPQHEATLLQLRADLMNRLALWITQTGLTQTEAAERLGVSQARISDLTRGKWKKFSIDMLITLTLRAGIHVSLQLDTAA